MSGAAPSQPDELKASLEAMMGLDYVRENEIVAIPVLKHESRHALYGPLADFPVELDVESGGRPTVLESLQRMTP